MPVSRVIGKFLNDHQLHEKTLVVAVSGGADSIALLHGLHARCGSKNLIAAHLNHMLRGDDSLRDAQHVESVAAQLGVRFVGGVANVPELMKTGRLSAETAARQARYHFLYNTARAHQSAWVLTAHHADDQVETIVFNFLRGSSITGLRGMRPVATLPYANSNDMQLARPLLGVTKEDITTYCEQHALQWVEDKSNNDTAHTRNRIRHELLPILADYAPTLRKRVGAMANTLAADEALLDEMTEAAFKQILVNSMANSVELDLKGWRGLHLSLRRRVLRHAITQLPFTGDMRFGMLDQAEQVGIRAGVGAEATLQDGWVLTVGYNSLNLRQAGLEEAPHLPQVLAEQSAGVLLSKSAPLTLANGWCISAELNTNPDFNAIVLNEDLMQAYVSIKEGERLFVRTRRDGERMVPLGGSGSRKIKEVMIDRKISAELRAHWPIISTSDHPIWIPGHLLDDRVKVQPEDRSALHLRCWKRS